jgi:hypothetical protein
MIFKKINIQYKDVLENNFLFTKINLGENILNFLNSIFFIKNDSSLKDCSFRSQNKFDINTAEIGDIIKALPVDEFLRNEIKFFEFTVDKYCIGDSMPMHKDQGRIFPYEILIYYPKSKFFVGRELHIENSEYDFKFKPKQGSVCFVNTFLRDNDTFHGVTELKTDTEIYVITGGMGLDSKKHQEYYNI